MIVSHCFHRADDTTELMEEAAQVAPCSGHLDSADTTQALLKTFAWVEPPDEDTCCLAPTEPPPHHIQEQQLGNEVQKNNDPVIEVIRGMIKCCDICFPYISLSVVLLFS